jgi:hypothetical protein
MAQIIPRPDEVTWRGGDFELGRKDLLVFVIARAQHHPVLAKPHRLFIEIGGNVPDGENRHGAPQ